MKDTTAAGTEAEPKYWGVRSDASADCGDVAHTMECATTGTNPHSNTTEWAKAVKGGQSAQGNADAAASGEDDSSSGAPGFKKVLNGSTAGATPAWVTGTSYKMGQRVTVGGHEFQAKQDVVDTAASPDVNTTEWANNDKQAAHDSFMSDKISSRTTSSSGSIATARAERPLTPATNAVTAPLPSGTVARIEGTIDAGGSVRVRAKDKLDVTGLAGAVAGGFVGIGAAILVLNVESRADASIAANSSITAGSGLGDAVLVEATSNENALVISFAGSGGFVAVSAQVAVFKDTGNQFAHIDDNVAIHRAGGGLDVLADADRTINTYAIGVTTGAFSTGVSVAHITVTGDTKAEVGNVTLGDVVPLGHYNVRAHDHTASSTLGLSISGGVGVGVAAAMAFSNLEGRTYTRSGAHGWVGSGGVNITADGDHLLTALVINVSTGIGATGVTVARGNNKHDTETLVESGGNIATPGAVIVASTASNYTDIHTPGGSGGGVAITALLAFALVAGATRTTVNGQFTGTSGITIQAIGDNTAIANSFTVGVAAIGFNGGTAVATITGDARIETFIGSTAYLTSSGPVLIEAKTRNLHNRALATTKGYTVGILSATSAMISIATIEGAVRVQMDGTVSTTSTANTPGSPAIGITASGQNLADAEILVIDVGFGGSIAASVVDSEITSDADVEVNGTGDGSLSAPGNGVTRGLVEVTADSNNHSKAHTDLAAGGLLAVGVSVPTARVRGGTNVDLSTDVTDAGGTTVQSTSDNFAEVESTAVAVGVIPIAVTVADARVDSDATTDAIVRSSSSFSAPGGAVQVLATSTNHATTLATSLGVGVLALAYMQALSKVEGGTLASFDGTIPSTPTKTMALTVRARSPSVTCICCPGAHRSAKPCSNQATSSRTSHCHRPSRGVGRSI